VSPRGHSEQAEPMFASNEGKTSVVLSLEPLTDKGVVVKFASQLRD